MINSIIALGVVALAGTTASAAATPEPLHLGPNGPSSRLPPVCTNPPAPFCKSDVMIPDTPYMVPAMWGCTGKEMRMWCEVDRKGRVTYDYCCSDRECKRTNAPWKRTCKVYGKQYTVGKTYNVKLHGDKVKLWCTSEYQYVTCKGKQCGSRPELTPPGVDMCGKPPKPTTTTVVKPTVAPGDADCINCIKGGYLWNVGKNRCEKYCPMDLMSDCHRDLGRCPVRI